MESMKCQRNNYSSSLFLKFFFNLVLVAHHDHQHLPSRCWHCVTQYHRTCCNTWTPIVMQRAREFVFLHVSLAAATFHARIGSLPRVLELIIRSNIMFSYNVVVLEYTDKSGANYFSCVILQDCIFISSRKSFMSLSVWDICLSLASNLDDVYYMVLHN